MHWKKVFASSPTMGIDELASIRTRDTLRFIGIDIAQQILQRHAGGICDAVGVGAP